MSGLESLYDLLGYEYGQKAVARSIRIKLCDYKYSSEVNTWDEIVYKAGTIKIGEQEATRESAWEHHKGKAPKESNK